jgi:K+-transporting ATPase ATPase B chain
MSTTVSTPSAGPAAPEPSGARRVSGGLLDPAQLMRAVPDAVRKLNPRLMWRNPVMLIVEIGALLTTALSVRDETAFGWSIAVWL